MKSSRRDLLRYFAVTAGCYVITASPIALTGCQKPTEKSASKFSFPQGVASGDPQSDAVILWTRVEGDQSDVGLTVQVSLDNEFSEILSESKALASLEWDHTVRVLVDGLAQNSYYYYRFIAPDGSVSRLGRTKTAPAADSDVPLNVAVFSCQDYEQGFFTAYRHLIDQEHSSKPGIDFILHVGDFIYEAIRGPKTVGDPDLSGNQIALQNVDGSVRRVGSFPSGGKENKRKWIIPTSLEDYRHLYKTRGAL